MGLFKKKKVFEELNQSNDLGSIIKVLGKNKIISKPKDNSHNSFGENVEELTKEGELPWGWIAHHREFVDDIESKHKYFMHLWLESRSGSPKQQYEGLKSFIIFLNEAKLISASKGECYLKWFTDIIADEDYMNKRQSELNTITER